MISKKRHSFLIICTLFLMFSLPVVCQNSTKEKNSNAELVLQLIRTTSVTRVFIVGVNYHKEYEKQWLSNISINDNFLVFRKGNDIDYWNVESIVLVEKYGDVMKVRLKDEVGI